MNPYDIVEYTWESSRSSPEFVKLWFPCTLPTVVYSETHWGCWDRILFKLRNGQIVRVKPKGK